MCQEAPLAQIVLDLIVATFDLDVDELPEPLSQETVDGWNSLSHTVLLLNVEERFHVSLSLEQMVWMTSAERIVEVLHHMVT